MSKIKVRVVTRLLQTKSGRAAVVDFIRTALREVKTK